MNIINISPIFLVLEQSLLAQRKKLVVYHALKVVKLNMYRELISYLVLVLADPWIERAEDFLTIAKDSLERKIYALACFNSQQATELYLKAILVSKTGSHVFTHSLVELLESIESLGFEVPEELFVIAEALESHYIKARYPARHTKPYTERDAKRCIEYAKQIIRFAKKILEG